ncbi:MAG: GtrA family protein [Oscillospiraceae bacterium]|nr:GtrA family protein [Oscillospiraceae bacterium]
MLNNLIRKIVGIFPEPIRKLYYKYESALLYLFYGALTTVVSIGVQYLAIWLGAGTALSTTVSWICAVTFAFFVNKICVFQSESADLKDWFKQAAQFYGARLVSYFLELGYLLLTIDYLGFNAYIMKLAAQIFVLVINYLFSKFVIFRNKDSKKEE